MEPSRNKSHPNNSVLHPYFNFFLGGQEVWRVSTSTGPRRTRRLSSAVDAVTSSSYSVRDHELPGKSATTVSTSTNVSSWQGLLSDNSQVSQVKHMHNLFFAYAYTIGNKEGDSFGRGVRFGWGWWGGKCHYSLAHLIAVAVFSTCIF